MVTIEEITAKTNEQIQFEIDAYKQQIEQAKIFLGRVGILNAYLEAKKEAETLLTEASQVLKSLKEKL